ncbi:MAG: metalloregulator ArsR/SmtB family transcription factor [Chloroflexi bacterium]|nr:metalloregulator ArsR/SmtB family transcription factor [Chloroflexota bacterium]
MCDPNRLRIFASLRSGERCVQDIGFEVGLPQNLVSHHLSVLREAGLVKTRRDGHWVCYSVNRDVLAAIYPALKRVFDPDRVRA